MMAATTITFEESVAKENATIAAGKDTGSTNATPKRKRKQQQQTTRAVRQRRHHRAAAAGPKTSLWVLQIS
jgi:hypothetical protein